MARSLVKKYRRRLFRRAQRLLRDKTALLAAALFILAAGTIIYSTYMQNRPLTADPSTLKPLLALIAHAESSGNYNAYFGHGDNTSVDFTDMPIASVLQWQQQYVAQGSPSSAVGRYQFLNTTLSGLVQRLHISPSHKFDPATQDRLAIALLQKRGVDDYVNKQLTADQFAANLAKEWAALPKVTQPNPDASYYASDGLNHSRVSVSDVMAAIAPISASK